MAQVISPKETTRAAAYELWMNAPNPMVTFFNDNKSRFVEETLVSNTARLYANCKMNLRGIENG